MSGLTAIVASLLVGLSAQSSGASPVDPALQVYAKAQTLVTLKDGRRLNLYCTGQGSPTVILEGGWTANTASWRKVQGPLAATTRVCSYDRAGYGFSDAGPQPRTAQALADDLASLIKAADIKGPYVIVAHSLGALDARLFVDQHRREVAGLVLVDPATEYQDRELAKLSAATGRAEAEFEAGVRACAQAVIAGKMTADLPQRAYCIDGPSRSMPASVNAARLASQMTATYQAAALSEISSFAGSSSDQVAKSRRSWGDLPVIVLTAENTQKNPDLAQAEQDALSNAWRAMHEGVAKLSKRGENRLVPDTGHMIPSQRPEAVIEAVISLIDRTRTQARNERSVER
jgi:pimeloyl-ACP methyl ester carboxylesterase